MLRNKEKMRKIVRNAFTTAILVGAVFVVIGNAPLMDDTFLYLALIQIVNCIMTAPLILLVSTWSAAKGILAIQAVLFVCLIGVSFSMTALGLTYFWMSLGFMLALAPVHIKIIQAGKRR